MRWLLCLVLAAPVVAAGSAEILLYGDYEREPRIVVETKDCSGATGLASFRADRVFTVQEGECRDPDATDRPLHQVLLRSLYGVSRYDVIWVDEAGARTIREQLEENRQAALRREGNY